MKVYGAGWFLVADTYLVVEAMVLSEGVWAGWFLVADTHLVVEVELGAVP